MYLLDNNVISEMRKIKKNRANQGVVDWLKTTRDEELHTSIIVMIELQMWHLGKVKKDPIQAKALSDWYQFVVKSMFGERVFLVDEKVADICASLHVPDRKPQHDALIASTAIAHNLILVTRNVQDFDTMPVKILNPFA